MTFVAVDHLIVAAPSLDAGVAWCERTLGVTPGPGGQHPQMGTHNRLLKIASDAYPQAYLEIIAIDPAAPHPGGLRGQQPHGHNHGGEQARCACGCAPPRGARPGDSLGGGGSAPGHGAMSRRKSRTPGSWASHSDHS